MKICCFLFLLFSANFILSQNLLKSELFKLPNGFNEKLTLHERLDSLLNLNRPTSNSINKKNDLVTNPLWELIDSTISILSDSTKYKYVYLYDSQKRLIQENIFKWSLGSWKYYEKTLYTLNANGKRIEILQLRWENTEWDNYIRKTIKRNSNGDILLDLEEHYDNDSWIPYEKTERTYNEYNYLVEKNRYEWEGEWVLDYYEKNSYSPSGKNISRIYEYIGSGGHGYERTYNQFDQTIKYITYDLNEGVIENQEKIVREYNTEGYSTISTNFLWERNTWIKSSRNLSNYTNYKTTDELTQIWENENWINQQLFTAKYNNKQDLVSYLIQIWDGDEWINKSRYREDDRGGEGKNYYEDWINNAWEINNFTLWEKNSRGNNIFSKSVYNKYNSSHEWITEYDLNGNMTYREHNDWIGDTLTYTEKITAIFDSKNREISNKHYQWQLRQSENWESLYKNYTYYKNASANIIRDDMVNVSKYSLFQNYPNPFNPYTKISFVSPTSGNLTFSLYNMLGQKVKTIASRWFPEGVNYIEFDSSGLTSGTYFYRLEVDGFAETKKMIILK